MKPLDRAYVPPLHNSQAGWLSATLIVHLLVKTWLYSEETNEPR